jgi:heterodisulfide reductase subunit A-like polyferredoxin
VSYSFAAAEIAQKENFDVIYAFEWVSFLAGIEAKKISKKPLIVYLSETECDRSSDNCPTAIYHLKKYGLEMADKIILPSQKGVDSILKQYKLDPKKIVILNKKSVSIKESPLDKKQFIQV